MHTSATVRSLLAGLLLAAAPPLHAQRVEAGVVVQGGPVAGHVVIRDGYSSYRRPPGHRAIAVERVHRHRAARHWARHGYRRVILYYWDGRYYFRPVHHRHGVREVIVWERDGRHYHDCDEDREWEDRQRDDRRWDD